MGGRTAGHAQPSAVVVGVGAAGRGAADGTVVGAGRPVAGRRAVLRPVPWEHFSIVFGRPSIPIEVYLRMMFLRFHYKLGYESLCREVSDSISWRIFCRLNLDGPVPAPSTLSKITARCGEDVVLKLNDSLLARADAAKFVKTSENLRMPCPLRRRTQPC